MACGICGSIEEDHSQQSAHGFFKISSEGEPLALVITAGSCKGSEGLALHVAHAMREMKHYYPDKDFLVLPAQYISQEPDSIRDAVLQVSRYIAVEK